MKKLLLCLSLLTFNFSLLTYSQNTWQQMANMGGGARDDAGGFSVGDFGYILAGTNDTGTYFADLWQWNSLTDTWLKVDTFPGGQRLGTRAVSLGGFGYVIGGEIPSKCFLSLHKYHSGTCGGTFYNDLWRYCPDSNTWVQLSACPGPARDLAVAVADSVDDAIFYGTGNDNDSAYMQDWWEYDVKHNRWNQMADFPGGQRCSGIGFYLNGYVYVGGGNDHDTANNATSDMWKYDFSSNTWTQVSNIPGIPTRSETEFTIGNYAYITLGISGDTTYTSGGWRYDPINDKYLPITNFSGNVMADAVGFTINGYGYVCTGAYNVYAYSQFWQYTFDPFLGINELSGGNGQWSVYPNPSSGIFNIQANSQQLIANSCIEVYNVLGEKVFSKFSIPIAIGNNSQFSIDLSTQPNGIYFYQFLSEGKVVNKGKLVVAR